MPVPTSGWTPTKANVADYVPHRTLTRAESSTTAGEDTYQLTFSETTRPTGDAVDRLVADGVAWVSARVRPMHPASQDSARVAATLYAAAAVERGWPEDESALQRANDLEKRADTLLAALVVSNDAANAGDADAETVDVVLPSWSFPAADVRYDSVGYF